MEETPLAKFVHALVFLGLCAAILFVGWREPLRYRFMTAKEIGAELAPAPELPPEPAELAAVNPFRPKLGGTSLDRAPYETYNGEVVYTDNFDPHRPGTPTETDRRPNTHRLR